MPLTYPQPIDRPLVLGHRGASAHAGDNTLEAFQLVVEHGADGVELDVRFTADEQVVLSHDPVAAGFGIIVERTFAELRQELPHVPTLDEGAAVLGDLVINVEIKNSPSEPDFDPEHLMADRIATWVAEGNRYGRCVVTSFNPDTVARVRFLDDAIVTGLLLDRTADLEDAVPLAAGAGHNYIAPHRRLLRYKPGHVVRFAADHGLGVVVWTVDNTRTLGRLRRAGVAAVIANDTKAAVELYAEPLEA
ncbi:MAG: glycerophosphodiester phosphodiesterase [bacterium]|nr:glycerophosphodiester phosphodiesterase [bacterium]